MKLVLVIIIRFVLVHFKGYKTASEYKLHNLTTCTPTHAPPHMHPHTCTPTHAPPHMHSHRCTPTNAPPHMHPHTCTPTDAPPQMQHGGIARQFNPTVVHFVASNNGALIFMYIIKKKSVRNIRKITIMLLIFGFLSITLRAA